MASAGATQAHKLRPVDVLNQVLKEDRPGRLEQFFELFGPAEASAMCYFVATSLTQEASTVWYYSNTYHETHLSLMHRLLVSLGSLRINSETE